MHVYFPALTLMTLTAVIAFMLAFKRVRAAKAGTVDLSYYKLFRGDDSEPDHIRKFTRHLNNLFEAPLLFYVLTVMAYTSGQTETLVVGLCWAYVAARAVHTLIHLNGNQVIRRFHAFAASWAILVVLLITIGAGLFGGA